MGLMTGQITPKFKMELVWSNPNIANPIPVGATVGPGLGLSKYDLLIVSFIISTQYQGICQTLFLKCGNSYAVEYTVGSTRFERSGYITDAGIYTDGLASSGPGGIIPINIYGIKF